MSYDLVAEGTLDFYDLSIAAQDLDCADVFPIADGGRDAIGIAVLSKRTSAAGAGESFRAFVDQLRVMGATLHDLYKGAPIASEEDLDDLIARIFDA